MNTAPFHWPVRVYYEDTDAAGVVYYANYLKFMERARTEWLRDLGLEQEALARETGIRFAITRAEVDFLAPARLDDALLVTVAVVEQRRVSLTMAQEIQRGEQLLIRGLIRVACLDGGFRPTRLPEKLVQALGTNA